MAKEQSEKNETKPKKKVEAAPKKKAGSTAKKKVESAPKTTVNETKQTESQPMTAVNETKQIESQPMKNTMSDKTRYIIVGVVSVILLALIVVLIIFGNNGSNKTYTDGIPVEDRNLSTEALREFYDEFDSETVNAIIFARSSCSFCQLQKPILLQVAEDYNMPYYLLDTDTLSNKEVTEIMNALGLDGSTPITVVVQKGKVIAKTDGYLDGKLYVDFLKQNGLLPEDAYYSPEDKLISISYDEFTKLSDKDGKSLLLLDTNGNASCIEARKTLNKIAKENDFTINYISAAMLTETQIQSLIDTDLKKLGYDEPDYVDNKQISIPVLFVIKDGKIKDYVLQGVEESDYTKVLKKYDFIK